MHIIDRARVYVQRLRQLAQPTVWDWKRCPRCGSALTIRNGHYQRHPWTLAGRQTVSIQRHYCQACHRSYVEQPPQLVPGSWYGRDVHRLASDLYLHGRSSLRRTVAFVRSWLGQQERWWLWHPWQTPASAGACLLHASTLQRWLARAAAQAWASRAGQWEGVSCSGQMATDGLWSRLRDEMTHVGLMLVDCVTHVIWATAVSPDETHTRSWRQLFTVAKEMGLNLYDMRGVTADGAWGLTSCLMWMVPWVHLQRCLWHLWRQARQHWHPADGEAAFPSAAVHAVLDAPDRASAQTALAHLTADPQAAPLGAWLDAHLEAALRYQEPAHEGLARVVPEWLWRDFRQHLNRGRNHATDEQLQATLALWAIYHNCTPTQPRHERSRHYCYPGQSPLEVAGLSLEGISYLDALGI